MYVDSDEIKKEINFIEKGGNKINKDYNKDYDEGYKQALQDILHKEYNYD